MKIRLLSILAPILLSGCATSYMRLAETFVNEPESAVEVTETQSRYAVRSYVMKSMVVVNGQLKVYTSEYPDITKKHREAAEKLYPKIFGQGGIPVDIEVVSLVEGFDSGFRSASSSSTIIYNFSVNGKRVPYLRTLSASAYASSGKVGDGGDYQKAFAEIQPLSPSHHWRVSYTRSTWPDGTGLPGAKDPEVLPGSYDFGKSEWEGYRPFLQALVRRLRAQENPQAAIKREAVMKPRAEYVVKRFEKVKGAGTAYVFEIDYHEGGDISDFKKNQAAIRDLVQTDYAEANGANKGDVHVNFSSFNWGEGKLTGRAEVFEIDAPPYEYNPHTRRGKLGCRIVNGDFGRARAWVIKHVETIACSKNILLLSGEEPPKGKYRLLGERVKEENLLEIEFDVE